MREVKVDWRPGQFIFPELKNMDQRENFVRQYHTWPVWAVNRLTEEVFYRYDLPDGSAIVVRNYPCTSNWRNEELEGQVYYLLKPGYKHFKDCESCMTDLKKHLAELEKKLKGEKRNKGRI